MFNKFLILLVLVGLMPRAATAFDQSLVERGFAQSMLLGMKRKELQDQLKRVEKLPKDIAALHAQRIQKKLRRLEEEAVDCYRDKLQLAELQMIVDQAEEQFKSPKSKVYDKVHCLKRIEIAMRAAANSGYLQSVTTSLLVPLDE